MERLLPTSINTYSPTLCQTSNKVCRWINWGLFWPSGFFRPPSGMKFISQVCIPVLYIPTKQSLCSCFFSRPGLEKKWKFLTWNLKWAEILAFAHIRIIRFEIRRLEFATTASCEILEKSLSIHQMHLIPSFVKWASHTSLITFCSGLKYNKEEKLWGISPAAATSPFSSAFWSASCNFFLRTVHQSSSLKAQ